MLIPREYFFRILNSFSKKTPVLLLAFLVIVSQLLQPATIIAATTPIANPVFTKNCGLDIVLVLDNSSSITDGGIDQDGNPTPDEITPMKDAFLGLVSDLSGTPTEFAVTKFSTQAQPLQAFTNTVSLVNNAINSIAYNNYGATNWEAALLEAKKVLPNRANKNNIIIFASDGNPTIVSEDLDANNVPILNTDGTPINDWSKTDRNDLENAIIAANVLKNPGTFNTRIITFGVGGAVNETNLRKISGNESDDHYNVANFDALKAALHSLASDMCGGTITVTKKIGVPGNAQDAGAGWSFNIGGQAGKLTEASNGQTEAVDLVNGTYTVTEENFLNNLVLASAGCVITNDPSGVDVAVGTPDIPNKRVTGININTSNIISCTFYNTQCTSDSQCNDGIACNGIETCSAGSCVDGTDVDCTGSVFNLPEIGVCTNVPDGNPFTWDTRARFTSVCQEPTGLCSEANDGQKVVTSACVIGKCGASCASNSDCDDQNARTADSCNLDDCQCDHIECTVDADCSDGSYCNGAETCVAGRCAPGISVTCEMHDALGVCTNTPDGNPFTWDYRAGYSEVCNEATDSCEGTVPPFTHTCDKQRCSAQCAGDSDCPDTVCGTNGCVGKDYYTYANATHTCQGCSCTTEACLAPEISYNDKACTECQTNDDCTKLNAITCQGSLRLQSLGVCNNFACETATTTLPDCNDGKYCNGAESCSNGACVEGTPVSCTANNIFAIGTCDNTPDGNPWTYDFRAKFTSECQESTQSCSRGDETITHTCSKECDAAACVTNADCNDNNAATTDACNTDTCQCSNTTIPTCGDGAVNQTSEQCDNGASNGTPCVPAYGQSCEYCRADCASATVAGAFCGDGIANGTEQCDDGNSANDDACSNTCTTNNIPGQKSADLAVTKTVDPASVKTGQETIFTIHITNNGPDSAASTTVTDVLPSGLTFVSATSTAGVYTSSTGLWIIGDMAASQTETLKITALVSGTESTTITNHVLVEIDPKIDLNLSNNTADTTIVITTTGGSGGGNTSTGGDKIPTGGVPPQVAGASTEKPDLDDIQKQLDAIKQKISDIAAQIAKLPKGVLGATDVSTGACDNSLPESMDDSDLFEAMQKLRAEFCLPETATLQKTPAKPKK